jgi:DNA (cytosine-5)-methyltransferase 1
MHDRSKHPDLVAPTRTRLRASGTTYVIENVPGAPLDHWVQICGSGLGMRRLRRHRWFESNAPLLGVPCVHGQNRNIISVVGHSEGNGRTGPGYLFVDKCNAMGIDWMHRDELSQAIPPAYTEFIGQQLLTHLAEAAA